jgi:hypothetical protein
MKTPSAEKNQERPRAIRNTGPKIIGTYKIDSPIPVPRKTTPRRQRPNPISKS